MVQQLSFYLTVLGLGVQAGIILFFSFVLTPVLFGRLPREEAARIVGLCFPGYYLSGSLALGVALAGSLAAGGSAGLQSVLALALGLELYAWGRFLPQLERLREAIRDETDPLQARWRPLHRLSVQLNLAVLALALSGLALALPAGPAG